MRTTVCGLLRWASMLLALGGCGSESGEPPAPCDPPNRLLGERCLAPGVADDGCPAGTLGLPDGICQPAGIPPEMCGAGFVPSGEGCEPILPAEPCPPGLMAVPGDSECREVMPCGAGKWGDIPVDDTTVYVDQAYAGGGSDGSSGKPWASIGEAIAAAPPGALVAIAAGSYAEDLLVAGKSVRLWGVCPAKVELIGSATALAALDVRPGGRGTEAHGLAIRGGAIGILLSGATGLILDRLWVHDAADRGVNVEATLGPTSVSVHDSLIERNHAVGVRVTGTEALIEATVVRGTLPQVSKTLGRGIDIELGPTKDSPTPVIVRASLVEQNHDVGVYVSGSEALIETTVVRGTLPRASDQLGGRGIGIQDDPATGIPATATVRTSMIDLNHEVGLVVFGSETLIEATVVRGTLPRQSDQTLGVGITIRADQVTGAPAIATVRASLVEQNHELGLFVIDAEALIEATVVRGTLPAANDQEYGRGVEIESYSAFGTAASATVRASVVEQNHEVGVFVGASSALIETTVVRGTLPRASDQWYGRGIAIEAKPDTGVPSNATVRASLVEQNHDVGLVVVGSEATLESLVVRQTAPRQADGLFGDGVAVFSALGPATVSLTRCTVSDNARAGLSNFGASATILDSVLACNGFDLEGETYEELPFAFDNQGGNVCGCPAGTEVCGVESTGLAPPEPLEPNE